MQLLNRLLGALQRLQLHCHGEKPVLVVLPDGTRLEVSRVWATQEEVFIEVSPKG